MTKMRNLIVGLAASLAFTMPATSGDTPQSAVKDLNTVQLKQLAQAATLKPINTTPCAAIKPYVDWCKKSNYDKFYWLGYTLTSNNSTNNTNVVVGYAEGGLHLDANKGTLSPMSTNGDHQWFNDRRWGGSGLAQGINPFDPNKADLIELTLNPAACSMTIVLKSWGNNKYTIPLQGQNGLLYGFGPGPTIYTLAIRKNIMDIPK